MEFFSTMEVREKLVEVGVERRKHKVGERR